MKKKVLFFRPTLGQGGADRVTATLLRHFDRSRFELSIALLRVEGEFLDDIGDDVAVHRLDAPRLARAALPLWRLLRQERPDVLFSTSTAANIPAVVAHTLYGRSCRLVLSERAALLRSGRPTLKGYVEVALKRPLYRLADSVTVVSQGVGNELVKSLGIPGHKIDVVYNPVVHESLERQAKEPLEHGWFSDSTPVILAAGRLVAVKDYPTLLKAFAALRQRASARLVVLGDGPERNALIELAAELGVSADVQFAGFDKNPFRYMSRCAAFVLSSRAEGLPGVLIQAMACGAPAIATDCRHGPNEIIQAPGTDGLLVPVGDVVALADAMERVLSDPSLRAGLAERGKAAAQRFSLGPAIARYESAVSA